MSHATEFPNALNDIPRDFLTQFEDQSWHNDMCPNFRILGHDDLEENHIKLWIEHENEELRECEGDRFVLIVDGGDPIFLTDSFDELKTYLELNLDDLIAKSLLDMDIAINQSDSTPEAAKWYGEQLAKLAAR